jgi:hypothetical protein
MTLTNEQQRVAAYQRGWNSAVDYSQPALNPFPVKTDEWYSWWTGRNDAQSGKQRSLAS